MTKKDLVLAIIDFLAKQRNGIQDIVEIFRSVMNPSPKYPKRWAEMTIILEKMRRDDLVQTSKQYLEGRRIAIFYQLTAKGWTTARRGGEADESRG